MERTLYGKEYGRIQSRDIPKTLRHMLDEHLVVLQSDTILELGVGNGALFPLLRVYTPHVYGVDINEWLLRNAKNPGTVVGDITTLPFRNSSFSSTVSMHVLEHIPDLYAVFQELDRVTVQGGFGFHIFPAFFLTKAEGAIAETLRMYPFRPLKAWQEAHRLHVHNLDPQKIKEFIKPTNFQLVHAKKFIVPETGGTNWVILMKK